MKQTAMQELKSDLILTKEITLNSFSAIKKQEIKDACIKVVEMTLNSIITRIDTELLAMEKEQIKMCCIKTMETCNSDMNELGCKTMDDYFNYIYNEI